MSPAPWQRTNKAFVTADTALVTTAETVVATLAGLSTQFADSVVMLRGWVDITTGTGVTGVTLRIRRTGVAGVLVGEGNIIAIGASTTGAFDVEATDNPGEIAGGVYVLTAQQAAATGNGSVTAATLEAVL